MYAIVGVGSKQRHNSVELFVKYMAKLYLCHCNSVLAKRKAQG